VDVYRFNPRMGRGREVYYESFFLWRGELIYPSRKEKWGLLFAFNFKTTRIMGWAFSGQEKKTEGVVPFSISARYP